MKKTNLIVITLLFLSCGPARYIQTIKNDTVVWLSDEEIPTTQTGNARVIIYNPFEDIHSKLFYLLNGKYLGYTAAHEYIEIECEAGKNQLKIFSNYYSEGGSFLGFFSSPTRGYCNTYEELQQHSTPSGSKTYYFEPNKTYYIGGWGTLQSTLNLQDFVAVELYRGTTIQKDRLWTSTNKNEHIEQNPFPKKAIISDIDSIIPASIASESNTYVLIITNEQYSYLDNVSYANHDGEIFKEYCVRTLGIPEKQIFYYENATFGKIADGVSKLQYCLNNFEGSKGIVYYCGHGIPDEKTGQAYLIPVDGKGTNMSTCYSLNTLYKTLAATKATSITYFMDACFTGANKEGSMLIAARGVAREPKKEVLAGKSIVFSASSGDETAMTLEEQGHGLFTYYLLKKLQETKGDVSYGELSEYIKRNVQKDAFLINEKPQTPMVATSPAVVNTWKAMKLK